VSLGDSTSAPPQRSCQRIFALLFEGRMRSEPAIGAKFS
jgi:hypothetical protein